MVATVYGRPAIAVEQPDGAVVPYLVRCVPARPYEWAAWVVTSPRGHEYRVTEFPTGFCYCDCPAWKFNRGGHGRWQEANGSPICKHAGAVFEQIINPSEQAK